MRLFFAITPGRQLAAALHAEARRLAAGCHGRVVPQGNLHLTLAFVGEVASERLDTLLQIGAQLAWPAGASWQVDRAGSWPGGIVWADGSQPCPVLLSLAAQLQSTLDSAGFLCGQRAYRPHITLLRHAGQPLATQALPPRALSLQRVALMASTLTARGPHYRTVQHWDASRTLPPPV